MNRGPIITPGSTLCFLALLWVAWVASTGAVGGAQDESRDRKALARLESPPLGLPPVPVPDETLRLALSQHVDDFLSTQCRGGKLHALVAVGLDVHHVRNVDGSRKTATPR